MRPLARLEDEPKSGAISGSLFLGRRLISFPIPAGAYEVRDRCGATRTSSRARERSRSRSYEPGFSSTPGDPGLFYRIDAVPKPGGRLDLLGGQAQGFQFCSDDVRLLGFLALAGAFIKATNLWLHFARVFNL